MARRIIGRNGGVERDASVLVLTVWTLFFLSALAVAVGSYVSGGLRVARQASSSSYGRAAMLAGIEHAVAVVEADTNQWDGFSENWGADGDIEWDGQELGESTYRIYHVNSGGITNFGLIDEESRININKADRKLLEALFRVVGKADTIQASSLAAAVIDWRDPDDEVSEGGAEGGFYAGKQSGYRCPNADFKTPFELLLINGMTSDIYDRIRGVVTVYGIGKVNVNTADRAVLAVLAESAGADPMVADGLAGKIEEFRKSGGAFSEANAMSIVGGLKDAGILGAEEETALIGMMMSISLKGTCFRGISEGRKNSLWAVTTTEFVYNRNTGRILYWYER
jgi:type II secretory pathway component PulK